MEGMDMGSEVEVDLDSFQSILIISLQRIYDAQMTMLMHMNPTQAEKLAALHEQGRTLSPPFAWSPEPG